MTQKEILHLRRMRKTNLSLKCHCKKKIVIVLFIKAELEKVSRLLVGIRKFSFRRTMNTAM